MFGNPRHRRRIASDRRGTVLILVLAILTLSVLTAARLASGSYQLAFEAIERERAAVSRWEELSCRRVLLPRAAAILTQQVESASTAAEPTFRVIDRYQTEIVLNDVAWTVTIADEQAKADVNLLLRIHDASEALSRIRRLSGASGLPVQQRLAGASNSRSSPVAVSTWEQVFQLAGTREPTLAKVYEATRELTCWGRGRVHLQAAAVQTLHAVCDDALDEAGLDRLMKAVAKNHDGTLVEFCREAQLSEREIERLTARLTDHSTQFSMWLIRRGPVPERACFTVTSTDVTAAPLTACFRW